MPFRCYSVFNSGTAMYGGKVLLLLRVERCTLKSYFYLASSDDGINFKIEDTPIDYPFRGIELRHSEPADNANRFDPRITRIGDTYYIYHFTWTDYGSTYELFWTKDFRTFESQPYSGVPSNRNIVLFPERIDGMFARLERPMEMDKGSMWVSFSPDLEFWGRSRPVELQKAHWSRQKNGAGTVPIKTPEGWLIIYHGTSRNASAENYYLGAALLDLHDPSKVVAVPQAFILAPEKIYEAVGQVPNVVFTSGAVEMPDGTLNVYYGGADTRVCLAQTTVKELVSYCLESE
jgi:beta-1,4-mannooligosaccharide/beta-1,4-mannosyl-N-acetylglucosamine phosphorylase